MTIQRQPYIVKRLNPQRFRHFTHPFPPPHNTQYFYITHTHSSLSPFHQNKKIHLFETNQEDRLKHQQFRQISLTYSTLESIGTLKTL